MAWEIHSEHRWGIKGHTWTKCFVQCQFILGKYTYLSVYICMKQTTGGTLGVAG